MVAQQRFNIAETVACGGFGQPTCVTETDLTVAERTRQMNRLVGQTRRASP